ncbi:hypothetical protein A1D31_37215 [Bradyrhizobium liaoningense]|nr:hypothetical protein A1D31_37215 [Bradyrhizobium liaoningense]
MMRLVGALVLQKAIEMNVGFIGKYMHSNDRVFNRNRTCGRGCYHRGDVLEFGEYDSCLAPIEPLECDRDVLEPCIPGSLAQCHDGHCSLARVSLDGEERVGGCACEIVVTMKFELEIGGRTQPPDQRVGCVGIKRTERICNTKATRTRGICGCFQLGARGVLTSDGDVKSALTGIAYRSPHPL